MPDQSIGEIVRSFVDDCVAVGAEKNEIFVRTPFFLRQFRIAPGASVAGGEYVSEFANVDVA